MLVPIALVLAFVFCIKFIQYLKEKHSDRLFIEVFAEFIDKHIILYASILALPLMQLWLNFLVSPPHKGSFPVWFVIPFLLNISGTCMTVIIAYKHNVSLKWLSILIFDIFLTLIGSFAGYYYNLGGANNWSIPLSHLDAIYFALGTLTSAGTGNITPLSESARAYVSFQIFLDFFAVTIVLGLFLTKLSDTYKINHNK